MKIPEAFIEFYTDLLGTNQEDRARVNSYLVKQGPQLMRSKGMGEWKLVELILSGLKTFSQVSGLNTNAAKSNIYMENIETQCLQDICELTGYQQGTLPFRYLGVLISSKKLSATNCEMLVDKLAIKVRTWGTKHLSFAGR
ncbi:uncharacterized protein LOC107794719 [Nicotiana tabacum]|uniref:Uncharacterized protein LOC107794719 n=1 Tax=Nicotiana tabacum TaxID=4097 RepID=A0A1S4A7W2_TOBAC|nr:PREDICTED: uncharacterized protein LOC107794719 [Nicotiana tabacum]